MKRSDDWAYFAARLEAERQAAAAATCEASRASHLELAEQYRQRLDSFGRVRLVGDPDGSERAEVRRSAGA